MMTTTKVINRDYCVVGGLIDVASLWCRWRSATQRQLFRMSNFCVTSRRTQCHRFY